MRWKNFSKQLSEASAQMAGDKADPAPPAGLVSARKNKQVAHARSHALADRPERLETCVLESLGHPIIAVDLDEIIIYWNKAAESLYGWRADEALGRHARELVAPEISDEQAQEIIEVLLAGRTWRSQVALRRRDGSTFAAAMANTALHDPAGNMIGFTTMIRDVTTEVDAEGASRQMSASLAQAQRIASLGSWELDPATGHLECSDALLDLLCISRESAPDLRAFWERLHPDDAVRVQEELRVGLAEKRRIETDCRIVLPDGTIKMIHARGQVTSDDAGRPVCLAGTVLDITRRWQAEEALRASEERFRTLVATTAAVVWCTDAAGRSTQGLSSWTDFTGMTPEEMLHEDGWFSAVHPNDRSRAAKIWREALERGTDYYNQYRLRRSDGAWRDMIARGAAIRASDGSVREWVGSCVDVTDFKAADEAARLQARLLDAAGESIIATDPAGKIIYINRFAEAQFGWSTEEAVGADIMDVTVPSTSRAQALEIMEALRSGEKWSGEFLAQRRGGATFPIAATNTPLYDEGGELVAVIGVARDLTERHKHEQALRQSKERFRATFEQAPVGMCEMTATGKFTRVNPRLCEMWGYARGELLKLKFGDITHPDDLPRSLELVGELLRGERESFAVDKRYIRKDGATMWAHSTVSSLRDGPDTPQRIIAVVEDITETRRVGQQLVRSEARLRALTGRIEKLREEERTRIAREIHDELGQLLTGLKMDLRWVENWLEKNDDPKLRPFLDRIVGGTELTDAVIKAVQAIATDLRPGVLDTLGLAAALSFEARRFEERTGTRCRVEAPPELPPLSRDVTTALFRIFQECLTNVARHSGATEVHVSLHTAGGEVHLCIADNGCGIADVERVASESLGLVGIKERVALLGGRVSFGSRPGDGTTVELRLPGLAHLSM